MTETEVSDSGVISIGIVGDFDASNETHLATTNAIDHAAARTDSRWIATKEVEAAGERVLAGCSGIVIAPGSPYESMAGALAAIRFARTNDMPLLGTCGGFQHVVIEYARNVLGIVDAQHAEYDPYASTLFITPLSCSLVGQQMEVLVAPATTAFGAYQAAQQTERYYCNFGLNPEHLKALIAGGLVVSGVDQDGEVRILELPDHRFFVATLFVPQASSAAGRPHPIVQAFVNAASQGS